MNGASIEIYADRSDINLLLESFNSIDELKYVQALSGLNQESKVYDNAEDLTIYQVDFENPNSKHLFLCIGQSDTVNYREIKMKDGSGNKAKADELYNPTAISILLGGEAAPNTIVQTVVSSTYYSGEAKLKLKSLKKVIDKYSTKVKSFRVMPSAYEKLLKGFRLTQGIEFNRNYDLKAD